MLDCKNFKKLRKENKLTQKQVAEIMEVQREVISYYENGTRVLPLLKLNKFLDFLGLTLNDYENGIYKSKIKIFCKKDELDKNYHHMIWLNKFINNLDFIRKLKNGIKKKKKGGLNEILQSK